MSFIVSIVVFGLGAILYFAGLHTVGLVLMIVGAVATGLSIVQLALATRRGRRPPAAPR